MHGDENGNHLVIFGSQIIARRRIWGRSPSYEPLPSLSPQGCTRSWHKHLQTVVHPISQYEAREDTISWSPHRRRYDCHLESTSRCSVRKHDDRKTSAGASSALASAAASAMSAAERRPRAVRNLTYLAGEVRKAGLRWVALSRPASPGSLPLVLLRFLDLICHGVVDMANRDHCQYVVAARVGKRGLRRVLAPSFCPSLCFL